MNRQNHRFCSDDTNPHWPRKRNFQTAWEINAWLGGFIGGILDGRKYLHFFNEHILLDDVSLDTREHTFFQQDSVPARNSIIVRQHLN